MEHSEAFLRLVEAARLRVKEVPATDLPGLLAGRHDALLLDVREESEWRAGHLQGARHLGKGVIERDIVALCPDLERPVYLYCGGGYRSILAADNLQAMGYRQVYSVAGGWRELQHLMPVSVGG